MRGKEIDSVQTNSFILFYCVFHSLTFYMVHSHAIITLEKTVVFMKSSNLSAYLRSLPVCPHARFLNSLLCNLRLTLT